MVARYGVCQSAIRTHDLSSGYWQTPMATEDGSDLKTAFVTEQGQFCWRVMPFGLRNSGATMSRLADEVLGDRLAGRVSLGDEDICQRRVWGGATVIDANGTRRPAGCPM